MPDRCTRWGCVRGACDRLCPLYGARLAARQAMDQYRRDREQGHRAGPVWKKRKAAA